MTDSSTAAKVTLETQPETEEPETPQPVWASLEADWRRGYDNARHLFRSANDGTGRPFDTQVEAECGMEQYGRRIWLAPLGEGDAQTVADGIAWFISRERQGPEMSPENAPS